MSERSLTDSQGQIGALLTLSAVSSRRHSYHSQADSPQPTPSSARFISPDVGGSKPHLVAQVWHTAPARSARRRQVSEGEDSRPGPCRRHGHTAKDSPNCPSVRRSSIRARRSRASSTAAKCSSGAALGRYVGSPNAAPTCSASVGDVPARGSGRRGRRFKSCHPDHRRPGLLCAKGP